MNSQRPVNAGFLLNIGIMAKMSSHNLNLKNSNLFQNYLLTIVILLNRLKY